MRDLAEGEAGSLKKQLKRTEELLLKQQETIQQLTASVLKQQEQIQVLKNRIEKIDDTPATVAREEIQEEATPGVENYLATDDARETMGLGLQGKYAPVSAYYMPDKEKTSLGLQTGDGTYSLYVGFRFQSRFTYKDNDEDFGDRDKTDIDVRRARLCFGGNIYDKDMKYYVEIDGDSFEVNVRDYYVYWTPIEEFNVKTGYFKVPANRQWNASGFKLLLQDRSIASDAFKQDRDYGLDIFGQPFDGHVEYHLAVFRGAGQNPSKTFGKDENIDNELLYVMSARYNPFGIYDYYGEDDVKYSEVFKATVGASVVYNGKEKDEKPVDTQTTIGEVDLGIRYKGFTWDSEYYARSKDPESGGGTINSDGFYTQTGYFLLPRKLELAVRYSQLDPDNGLPDNLQREYATGVNYYFREHRSKIQSDVGRYVTDGKDGDKHENRFRLQYQIIF